MKKLSLIFTVLICLFSCTNEDAVEKEISKIEVDFTVERFDKVFAKATPKTLPQIKSAFPFMFSKHVPDSIWVNRINDTLQQELFKEVEQRFNNFTEIEQEIEDLFQHLKYYDKTFVEPRIITLTSDVDYRNKTIVTDTIALIALDTYLGADHFFYEGIQDFLKQNFEASQIVCDLATNYSENYIYQPQKKTLLDEMIYFGKQLYFKDKMIPFKSDAHKIGYTPDQLAFAQDNEPYIWSYFIEREMLYSTDSSLVNRFIASAPFTKFYLELDRESPGQLGQYIGWQIVRAYMKHNDIPLMEMLQKDALEIFNNANYKPAK